MTDDKRDAAIARHVDAVRALLGGHGILGILAVDGAGYPYFVAPPENEWMITAVLEASTGVTDVPPEST
jgi:hypothetical protein